MLPIINAIPDNKIIVQGFGNVGFYTSKILKTSKSKFSAGCDF